MSNKRDNSWLSFNILMMMMMMMMMNLIMLLNTFNCSGQLLQK
jgi:hypothetical protein